MKDTLRKLRSPVVFCFKINGILLGIDLFILIFLSPFWDGTIGMASVGFLAILLLLEAGLMLMIGGATEMTSTVFFSKIREYVFHSEESWSIDMYRKGQQRALRYILTGAMLFAESMVLALLV